ncbi:MAG: epoxyqueuosine reductase [Clostridia bacterium]|nr:epoxyqueuosine reductase [Clostridia bacterium]
MRTLAEELETLAKKEGARLFGVAPVERFKGAPQGHHPLDFLPEAQNVIVIGIPIPKRIINYHTLLKDSQIITGDFRQEYLQRYFYQVTGYDTINQRLEQIALLLTLFLEDRGIPTIYFPPTYGPYKDIQDRVPGQVGIFSMRHAATRAGLGEFGFNNVVVTPKYGPRVRFTALITAAELEPTPLLKEKLCKGRSCMACVKQCGTGALKISENLTVEEMMWYDPVSRTDIKTCRTNRLQAFCYGKCLRVCPVGT